MRYGLSQHTFTRSCTIEAASWLLQRLLFLLALSVACRELTAAIDVRRDFVLTAKDAVGTPQTQNRLYFVYRPDSQPRTSPIPMVLVMVYAPCPGPAPSGLHSRAGPRSQARTSG
jgi:hypothetical protein